MNGGASNMHRATIARSASSLPLKTYNRKRVSETWMQRYSPKTYINLVGVGKNKSREAKGSLRRSPLRQESTEVPGLTLANIKLGASNTNYSLDNKPTPGNLTFVNTKSLKKAREGLWGNTKSKKKSILGLRRPRLPRFGLSKLGRPRSRGRYAFSQNSLSLGNINENNESEEL